MDINDIIKPENKVYGKSSVLTDNIMHYCPGCSHGVVHKLVARLSRRWTSRTRPSA